MRRRDAAFIALSVLTVCAAIDDRFDDLVRIGGTYFTPGRIALIVIVLAGSAVWLETRGRIHLTGNMVGLAVGCGSWILLSALSSVVNDLPSGAIARTVLFAFLVGTTLIARSLTMVAGPTRAGIALSIGVLPLLIIAILEALLQSNIGGSAYQFPYREIFGLRIWRVDSWLIDANFLAIDLLATLFCWSFLARKSAGLTRVYFVAMATLTAVVVVATGSRGALLGVIGGVVVWFTWPRRHLRSALLALALLVGVVAAAIVSTRDLQRDLQNGILEIASRDVDEQSSAARLIIWYTSLEGRSLDQWLIGAGPAQFMNERIRRFGAVEGRAAQYVEISAHSTYVEQLIEVGLIGLCGFLFMWYRLLRDIPADAPLIAGQAVAVLIAFAFLSYWSILLFAAIGVAAGLSARSPRLVE